MTSVPHSGAKSVTPGGSVAGGHTLWTVVEHSWSETGVYEAKPTGRRIALVEIDPLCEEETQDQFEAQMLRDARLISAAPDLLEALQYAVNTIEAMRPTFSQVKDEGHAYHDQVLATARAAIAKATAGDLAHSRIAPGEGSMTDARNVVVPIDPTPEMLGSWYRVKNGHHYHDEPPPTDTSDYAAYRAMLAAAPAPSSLAGGEVQEIIETLEALTKGPDHDEFDRGARAARLDALDMIRPLAALSPEAPAREAATLAMNAPMTKHPTLRSANIARQDEWDQDGQITASYRGNELAGEVGEACNVIKKLERERLGILGSRATVEQLADELADVVICADLIAMHYGIDLEAAIARKFNATSEKVGLRTRLVAPTEGGEA